MRNGFVRMAAAAALAVAGGAGAQENIPGHAKIPGLFYGDDYDCETVDVGSALQPLWGDRLVDAKRTTAVETLHRPEYEGVALVHDAPWEGDSVSYHVVVPDGDVVRLYYIASASRLCEKYSPGRFRDGNDRMRVCYAESRDGGKTFVRPELGLVEAAGTKRNNVIIGEPRDNFFVFRDTNPACPKDKVFRSVYEATGRGAIGDDGKRAAGRPCLWSSFSADGIHFDQRNAQPITDQGNFDSQNVMFWDATRGEYRCYGRGLHKPGVIRDIRTYTSKDGRKWSDNRQIDFGPGAEDYQLYTNVIQPYYRNPAIFVGFPARYVERRCWNDSFAKMAGADRRLDRFNRWSTRAGSVTWDTIFAYSYDGIRFTRKDEAFVTSGPETAINWTYGDAAVAYGMFEVPGRRGADPVIRMYVTTGHVSGSPQILERYAIRRDGFISYRAPYRGATLVTKKLVFRGTDMFLNFATSARGNIYVTVRDGDGNLCRSHEIFGDKTDRKVGWAKGSPAAFAGKPVTVEFAMRDADVYSFRFK